MCLLWLSLHCASERKVWLCLLHSPLEIWKCIIRFTHRLSFLVSCWTILRLSAFCCTSYPPAPYLCDLPLESLWIINISVILIGPKHRWGSPTVEEKETSTYCGLFHNITFAMAGSCACHFLCVKLHQHRGFVATVLNLATHNENPRVKFLAGYFLTFMVFFLIKCNAISRDEKWLLCPHLLVYNRLHPLCRISSERLQTMQCWWIGDCLVAPFFLVVYLL